KELDELNIILLDKLDRCIVEIDNFVYFLSYLEGVIISKVKLFSPLIGLHMKNEKLLILEETGLKLVDGNGKINQKLETDLVVNFSLTNDILELWFLDDRKKRIELLF
ncbi:MAG: hypothetical protein ACEPOW_13175, partial [Bacteroidales bacterium]